MDIVTEPEMYSPNVDDIGNYIDFIPSPGILINGVKCPCGTRINQTYNTPKKFSSHIKTLKHKKWIEILNNNKNNYFREYYNQKKIIKNQQKIIAEQNKQLTNKEEIINILIEKNSKPQIVTDLINLID